MKLNQLARLVCCSFFALLCLGVSHARAALTGPVGTVSFGSVRVLNTAEPPVTLTQTITVNNTTGAQVTLNAGDITFASAAAVDYTLITTLPVTIAGNSSEDFVVEFNPSAAGVRAGLMKVKDGMGSLDIPLTGTGLTAQIATPTNVSFGIVTVGQSSSSLNAVVNRAAGGTGILSLQRVVIGGADPTKFEIQDTPQYNCVNPQDCSFVPPHGITSAYNIPVRCVMPSNASVAAYTATLTVTSDTDAGGDNTVTLTCTAGRADIVLSTMALNFGNVRVPGPSTIMVNIRNDGNQQLQINNISKGGANPGDYAIPGSTSFTLNPNTSVNRAVEFRPTTQGTLEATIDIDSNDPDDPIKTITLTGVGTQAIISSDVNNLAFGSVMVNTNSTEQTVTITNTGNTTLTVSNAVFSSGSADYVVTAAPTAAELMVAPAGMIEWKIVCRPSTTGSRIGNFRITSDANNAAQLNIPLSCTGERAELAFAQPSTDIGSVWVGQDKVVMVTIRNTGTVTLTDIAAGFTAPTNEFQIVTPPATTLAPNATTTIGVQFNPTLRGSALATVQASAKFNGVDITPATAQVRGKGVELATSTAGVPLSKRWNDVVAGTITVTDMDGGTAGVSIQSVTFTASGMTAPMDVSITGPTAFLINPANQTRNIGLSFQSVNRVGDNAISGDVVITALVAGAPKVYTVPILVDTTSAMVATSMTEDAVMERDGVPVIDIDQTRKIRFTLRVENTATGAFAALLDTQAAVLSGGSEFTIISTNGFTQVAPGQAREIIVEFTAPPVNPRKTPYTASVKIPVGGNFDMPAEVGFMFSALAIDRELSKIDALPMFPTTFSFPGDNAPVQVIRVTNTGLAPLKFTPRILGGDGDWTCPDDGVEIEVAGMTGTTPEFYELLVYFDLKGDPSEGTLEITHDDNDYNHNMMMRRITMPLRGGSRDRLVNVEPKIGDKYEIDFEPSAAGIATKLSEQNSSGLLTVINADTFDFKIKKIELVGDSEIKLVDPPADLAFAQGETLTFDIEFSPQKEGTYETTAFIYLDENPDYHQQVKIRASAVKVELYGGGGCSTTNSTGMLTVLLIGLAIAGRLRRRKMLLLAPVIIVFSLPLAKNASAQVISKNLDLSLFRPTPSARATFFHSEGAVLPRAKDWSMQLAVSHAANPLISRVNDGLTMETSLISARSSFELGFAYAVNSRLELAARLPFYVQDGSDSSLQGLGGASGNALGDVSLHGKLGITQGKQFAFAASLMMTAPTAKDDQLAGSRLPTGLGRLIATMKMQKLTVAMNLGAMLRAKTQYAAVQGSEFQASIAASYAATSRVAAVIDGFATAPLIGDANRAGATATLLAGARLNLASSLDLSVAAGRGLLSGPGSPSLLATAMIGYATRPQPPSKPKVVVVPKDTDGDGIFDDKDNCETEAEDQDLFEDGDGCPEKDNDADLVADASDKCPLEGEDRDGFEDDDGCIDKDNDKDGVFDPKDKCPNQPEDPDNHADLDGCPDPDNDDDGILDHEDKCPAAPETINGKTDQDGCPDEGDSLVAIATDRIELFEAVTFSGNNITRGSNKVLEQVAALLRARKDIKRLRVVVHVNARGDKDEEVSQTRADAVRDWLVKWGIAPNRVDARGFGSSKMLVPAKAKNAMQINERVEFVIIERAS